MADNTFNPRYFSMLARCMKKRDELRGVYHKDEQDQDPQEDDNVIHTSFSSLELKLLIREFDPSKNKDLYATEWIREIEQLGLIHNWDSGHKLLYASMRLGGIAKYWYQYSIKSINNWDDFKKGLMGNFPRTIDAAEVHSKLIAKKRRSVEMLEEYFHTTVQLGKRIKLSDDSIKDYLIRGLEQPKHQLILSSIGPCSLGEFLQHMQRLEGDSQASSMGQPSSIKEKSQEITSDRSKTSTSKSRQTPNKSSEKLEKDNFASVALQAIKKKNRRQKCPICESEDHLAYVCPTIPNNSDGQSDSKPKFPNSPQKLTDEDNDDDPEHIDSPIPESHEDSKENKESMREDDEKDWVIALQNKDPMIFRYRQILKGIIKRDNLELIVKSSFRLMNGRLYSCQKDGLRFVVPKYERYKIAESFHISNGHLSAEKCTKEIKKIYWFSRMNTYIRKYLKICTFCSIRKFNPEDTLHDIYTSQDTPIPFHTTCVDFCGAFPKTPKNSQYVFSVVDGCTKFMVLKAVTDPTMNIAMKVIDLIAEYFGMPYVVVSKDSEIFKTEDFKKYCKDNGIQHVLVPNDATVALDNLSKKFEPLNNKVSELLTNDQETNWDEKLQELQMSYNNEQRHGPNSQFQYRLLQYDPKKKLFDKLYEAIKSDLECLKKSVDEEVCDESAKEDTEEVTEESHTKSGDIEETPEPSATFNPGDLVLAYHKVFQDTHVTVPCYRGPYIIKKVLPRGRCLITDTPYTQITSKRFNKIFPSNQLKKWVTEKDLQKFTELLFDETDVDNVLTE
ncbi:uncharacterized protein LOC129801131 isoform X2 [Phlebotomus papatasi]|uniref:uncharacterized protein LOC129801131 isoform X2 n=1 Tax=Phlebotomus papatasi TaxID=29031 RepID=UPI00248371CF|nr:uncharacterized protein LOC129801131 isoform X2 [Phlebotomus papatasi]